MREYILTQEKGKESGEKSENKNYLAGEPKDIELKTVNNHIYFYSGVNKKSVLELNIKLKEVEKELLKKQSELEFHKEYIYLHINSYGGCVFSCFSVIDTIKNLRVPVVSIIEGAAASAATLISVVCDYRIIYKTSYMLIHQLSSAYWGKMEDMEEEMVNLRELMRKIKEIYKNHTQISDGDLDEILKHDLWWNADITLEKGLVDEIRVNDKKYTFSRGLLDI